MFATPVRDRSRAAADPTNNSEQQFSASLSALRDPPAPPRRKRQRTGQILGDYGESSSSTYFLSSPVSPCGDLSSRDRRSARPSGASSLPMFPELVYPDFDEDDVVVAHHPSLILDQHGADDDSTVAATVAWTQLTPTSTSTSTSTGTQKKRAFSLRPRATRKALPDLRFSS